MGRPGLKIANPGPGRRTADGRRYDPQRERYRQLAWPARRTALLLTSLIWKALGHVVREDGVQVRHDIRKALSIAGMGPVQDVHHELGLQLTQESLKLCDQILDAMGCGDPREACLAACTLVLHLAAKRDLPGQRDPVDPDLPYGVCEQVVNASTYITLEAQQDPGGSKWPRVDEDRMQELIERALTRAQLSGAPLLRDPPPLKVYFGGLARKA